MARLELLDMPLEVVSNIFQFLPGRDQKNLALTCSAVLNIVAPTLYRTVRLFYDESQLESGFGGLPRLADVEHLISSPRFPLGYAKRLSIERKRSLTGLNNSRRGFRSWNSKKEHIELAKTADRAIGLILMRFGSGQLESIRLDHQTTYKTYALICEHQKKIRTLDLGDFKPGAHRSKVPTNLLAPGSMTLESLEICEIDERVTCLTTVLGIINQNAETLQKLRIGNPMHPTKRRLTTSSWARGPRAKARLSFTKINLSALQRFSIVHDHSAERFWDAFQNVIYCGGNLSHIKISCFTDPYVLVQKLVAKGANGIKSIQTNNCRRYTRGDFHAVVANQLPRIKLLETLQIQMCTNEEGEFQAAYVSRSTLKRLWLRCLPNCNPKKWHSMLGLLDSSTNMSLSSDNWPILEELAIGAPQWRKTAPTSIDGWLELPMLKSLKILRLLRWNNGPHEMKAKLKVDQLQPKVQAYVESSWWTSISYEQQPNLRVIIVDTAIGQGCPGMTTGTQFYFVVYYVGGTQGPNGPLPFVEAVSFEVASRVCKEINCSNYLLRPDLPAPDGFWEDEECPSP